MTKALECDEQALELDPDFALARAGTTYPLILRAVLGLGASRTLMPKAKATAIDVLATDDGVADADNTLAYVLPLV